MGACSAYIGNMLTCLEEGSTKFPAPVKNFHAVFVGDDSVTLEWDAVKMVEEDNQVQQYEVYYKELMDNSSSADMFSDNRSVNSTSASAVVSGLASGHRHQFFVIARNQFGTSLPSSVVTVNVTGAGSDPASDTSGRPSAPHSVILSEAGINYLTITWSGPAISHPEDRIKYK